MNDVKETIREFILATCLPGESRENLRDDTPLLTSGILDSLAALSLVSFLEKQFGVELDVYETSAERFNRILDIAEAVVRKRQLQAQPVGDPVS